MNIRNAVSVKIMQSTNSTRQRDSHNFSRKILFRPNLLGSLISSKLVLVMQLLGIGREGLNFFCGFMDLCRGLSSDAYERAVMQTHTAASTVFETLTKKAVEEEKIKKGENGR